MSGDFNPDNNVFKDNYKDRDIILVLDITHAPLKRRKSRSTKTGGTAAFKLILAL